MKTRFHLVHNNDGWKLVLKQNFDPNNIVKGRRPVVIIPGYGMNAFIFGYHPTGLSMEEYIVSQGFEVWSVNLRNQGDAIRVDGGSNYTIGDISLIDLPHAFDYIIENNETGADLIDGIGCSLGGTYLCVYAALCDDPKLGSLVSMGGPLKWVEVHPALKFAMSSPWLLGLIPLCGTRAFAKIAFPMIANYAPSLLKIYMHPEIVDISKSADLVQTVEDPNRFLNREIAIWVKNKDLYVKGQNVTEKLKRFVSPIMCMVANADGIVPEKTVTSALEASGSKNKKTIYCGNESIKLAHADMFISDYAHEMVFKPLCEWLKSQY
ncbi:MAG: hypothetical protein HQK79_08145 [Desulfobacterales bacterium]|nr:hypothetical protein [Desulfobacterales bacterium]MBF0398507.1 hypothetical protein [Desulfobacterales bacterium]